MDIIVDIDIEIDMGSVIGVHMDVYVCITLLHVRREMEGERLRQRKRWR